MAKRWFRLLVVLCIVFLSVVAIVSQLQAGEKLKEAPSGGARAAAAGSYEAEGPGLHLSNDDAHQQAADSAQDMGGRQLAVNNGVIKADVQRAEVSNQLVPQGGQQDVAEEIPKERKDPPGPELPPGALFVVVLILSETPDAPHRRTLRSSWAKQLRSYQVDHDGLLQTVNGDSNAFSAENLCRHFFVVGRLARILDYVRTEMETERDVVMVDENDYASTTVKLYSALHWAQTNLEFEYIIKTQDTIFLNLPGTIDWLGRQVRQNLYAGHLVHLARTMKKKRSPWYMDEKFYSGKFYPDYLLSFAVMLSHDIVEKLLNFWRGSLTAEIGLLHIDDLDMGIAMKNMSVPPLHCPHFFKTFARSLCRNSKMLAVAEVPREQLQSLGETSLQGKLSC